MRQPVRTTLVVIAVSASAGVLALPACSNDGIQLPDCGTIPPDGCPADRGGTCDDPLCAAVYDCVTDNWVLTETCSGQGGGAGGAMAGSGGGGAAGGGQGGCEGVVVDKTDEAMACTPDLQPPDCPALAAETCHPCQTGCEDFFLCTEDGWRSVAFCDQEGQLIVER